MAVRRVVRRKTAATKPATAARSRSAAPRAASATKTAPKAPAARRTASSGRSKAVEAKPSANGAVEAAKPRYGGIASTMPKGGGGLWNIPNEGMTVRFLGEPTETDKCPANAAIWWYEEWYDPTRRRSGVLEPGESPPEGARKSTKLVAAVWDRSRGNGEEIKYMRLPQTLLEPLNKYFARYGSICDTDAYLSKEGTGINTKYSVEFERQDEPIPAKKLAKIREILDVGGQLAIEAERLANMPDRAPEKKTIRELRTMDLDAFRTFAKSLGIVTKGKKRGEVIDEIMEAQAD